MLFLPHPCNLECVYTNFGWSKIEPRGKEFMILVRDVNALEYNYPTVPKYDSLVIWDVNIYCSISLSFPFAVY